QLLDDGWGHFQRAIDFLRRCVAGKAEPDRTMRDAVIDAHRPEHVRGLERTAAARCAARGADFLVAEQHEDGFRLERLETDVRGIRDSPPAVAVYAGDRNAIENALLQPVAQGSNARVLFVQTFDGLLNCDPRAHDSRDIFRSGAKVALLVAP